MTLNIPTDLVPLTYINIDNTEVNNGPPIQELRSLLVAQQTGAATVAEKTLQRIRNPDEAGLAYGVGSTMHVMAIAWFKNNVQSELYGFGYDDPGGGAAAAAAITVVGTATEAGSFYLYVAGTRLTIPVALGDDQTDIAVSIVAVVTADTSLPFTAANTLGVVDLTCKNTGVVGNQNIVQFGHFESEDALPAGVTSVIVTTPTAGGTGILDVDDVFTAIGEERFHLFAHPYNDATTIGKFDVQLTALNAQDVKKDGYAITCLTESVSNIDTAVSAYNSEFNVVIADVNGASPAYVVAAALTAQVALEGSLDPARPFQTLPLNGTIAPNKTGRTVIAEQQQLLEAGSATTVVDSVGQLKIQRVVTTYKTNGYGASDQSYRDLNTLLTLSTYRSSFDNVFATKYPRHKLADDGVRAASIPGQSIITPKIAKAEAIAHFIEMEELGLVEGIDQFKGSVTVVRNETDPNRLDFVLKPDLVNQFRVAGVEIKFLL